MNIYSYANYVGMPYYIISFPIELRVYPPIDGTNTCLTDNPGFVPSRLIEFKITEFVLGSVSFCVVI